MSNGANTSAPGPDVGRSALFLCVFWFYWITLTPFIDLTADPATAKPAEWSLVVIVVLFLILLAYSLSAPMRPFVAQPRALLVAIFGWLMLTALLGDDPLPAMRRVAIAITVCVSASTILLLPRDEQHFTRLLGVVVSSVLGICFLGVALLPGLAVHQPTDFLEPFHAGLWRGVFAQKNLAAEAMVLICFAGLYLIKAWSRAGGLIIFAGAAVFLVFTGSKTSMGMMAAVMILGLVFERWQGLRAPIVLGGIALINLGTLGTIAFQPVRDIIASSGIDPTFTARSEIWQIAFDAVAMRPLTGYGFQSFWMSEALTKSAIGSFTWAVAADHAHNAYLEAAVTAGLPGLVLMLVWLLFLPLRDIKRAEEAEGITPLTRLFIRIWLFCVFAACLESLFLVNSGPIWFTMLVAVFGLRNQARYTIKTRRVAPADQVGFNA